MSAIDHALALAARGFHVFPLSTLSKRPPEGVSWARRATCDPDRIRTMFSDGDNIGVATGPSGLLAVDVDCKHGKDGFASLLQLEMDGYELPETLTARTPTGGAHLFYRVPEPVKSGVNVLGVGLDIRSAGGFLVGVGSILDAREDQVAGEYTFAEPERPLADAPQWLIDRCGAPRERDPEADKPLPGIDAERARKRALEYLQTEAPEAVEGAGGDDTTYRVACRVRDFGVTRDECLQLMAEHWFEGCGWSPTDLQRKVQNAYKYAENRIGNDDPSAVFSAEPAPTPEARFTFSTVASTIAQAPPRWLIRGVLPESGMAVVYGAPGSGKTFLVLDMACAVAQGCAWGGRRTRRGRAVYVGLEGHVGTRVAAYVQDRQLEAADLGFLTLVERQPLNLLEPADSIAFARDLAAAFPEKPGLIVIDTLNRSMPGGDENKSDDMGKAILAASFLTRQLGCLVLFVHHSGKAESAGARGHSSLLGAADAELSVYRNESGERIAETTKVKDGVEGTRFAFTLANVDLGAVRDHDPDAGEDERVTSCAVHNLREVEASSGVRRVKIGNHAALCLQGLKGALSAVCPDEGSPFDVDDVLEAHWMAQVEPLYGDDAGWKKHFHAGRTELLRKKLVRVTEPGRVAVTETGELQ